MLTEGRGVPRVSGSQRPGLIPCGPTAPVAPHSVLQAVHSQLPAVSNPAYRWLFAAPLRSAAGALGCSWAGPRCFCWASGSGGRGGLGLAPGACRLATGERTPGTVSASEHHGRRWEGSLWGHTPSSLAPPSQQRFPSGDVPSSRAGQCLSAAKQVGRHCNMVLAPSSAGVLVCLLAGQVRVVPVAQGCWFLTVSRSELL